LRRMTKTAALLTAAVLTLSACGDGGDDTESNGSNGEGSAQSDVRVGMAYDVGGRGDQSFNDAAAKGLDQAVEEFGVESQEAEAADGEAESAREERLRTFAEAGFNPVIAVGFAYSESLAKVAPDYPEITFAIVDDEVAAGDNIANLVFAEEQGSFLVGAAAALKSKNDHVGFIGGVEVPLIQKFEAGFAAGAQEVNPDIKIERTYLTQPPDFSGFGDPAKGKTAAEGMFDAGADIVYHAAGGSGGGLFEAAKESGNLAIGVDSDQYELVDASLQDVIMTSMLKNVDVAVYDFLSAVVNGENKSGVQRYDLESDGVGYSTSGGQIDDITDKLDEYKQQIIDGEIKVPTS
jgi:basic membrane protein A and related proteins